jgi:ubiquinone/menaquinone biosynthesis C-methylase UbiE
MPATPKVSAEQAVRYDAMMMRLERRFFADTRPWICQRASGATLEIAVGTGLNLPHYPADVRLTGMDLNPAMLGLARERAVRLGREVALHVGDARHLPFGDATFDSVVCTFALCEVPDDAVVIREALRVLAPGGSLLLADHVVATNPLVRAGQHALEWITVPLSGERFTRRPVRHLEALELPIVTVQRFALGAVERVHARRP